MKKQFVKLCLLMALPFVAFSSHAAIAEYDAAQAKADAQADFANWMKYLPDDVFVAHVSIPGTHDTATGFGFCHSYAFGLGGATYSQTQMARIDEQLAGGVRAFDFRPGVHEGKLYCAHGLDITNYTMEQAFTMLTDYLDAHPKEFFVIHFFRGNVGYSGTGMSATESDRNNYNQLIDEFFNKGKFSNYIVDYDPYLKVKDIRGKMVLFRRDAIDFAHFAKAGNFGEWPWEGDVWTDKGDRYRTLVTHASDPTVKGYMRVSDMSSPDNASEIEGKKEAVKNLYKWCSTQPKPNAKKIEDGFYRPDWTMTFTSGEYQGVRSGAKAGGRSGYAYCANVLNPYLTSLINDTPADEKGPCGIVLSDWVLTDYSQDNQYQVFGKELIPAIAYNNFDYIEDFILDDEVFDGNEVAHENIWEDGKQYFMRNVGTGNFLSAGLWWGTHGVTAAHGIKITPEIDATTGKYIIKTTLGANGALDRNYYVDNGGGAGLLELDAKHVGNGKFVFTHQDKDNETKTWAVGVEELWSDAVRFDGATHNLVTVEVDESDPYQQWELISVEDYKNQQLRIARRDKGVDLTFLIPGARFFGNDKENDSWNVNNNNHVVNWGDVGDEDCRRCLTFYSKGTSRASWNLSQTVNNLPKGIYTIKWIAYAGTGHNDMKLNVSAGGQSYTGGIKNGTVGVKRSGSFLNYSYAISDPAKLRQEMRSMENGQPKFECKLENVKITDGKITITASDEAHSTYNSSVFALDDFELIYYGPIYPVLDRAIEDAKRRLGETPDWLATYETNMNNLAYDQEDEGAAPALEIYQKMRELTLAQTPDDDQHQDFTNAFINAGFETGTMMGWETSFQGENESDTDVKPNEGIYQTQGGQNQFLFNSWQKDSNPDNDGRGVILSQTIPGLPAGHYIVTANAANDEGGCIYIKVNDQLSEALYVEDAKDVSKLISFEFEVAKNTESVTISFMGGNADGSYEELGGNWYKLDDVHLYRSGSEDFCVFFSRLQKAMNRMEQIAATTLPQYYQDKWDNDEYHNTIRELIETHLSSGHSGDLGGSDGVPERDELHDHFSNIILSQSETNADMSGAIRNFSFEFGELIYWNMKAAPAADAVLTEGEGEHAINNSATDPEAKKDGKYFYYAKHNDGETVHAFPIYQSFEGLPAGTYRLTATVASDKGSKFVLAANEESAEATMEEGNTFQNISVEFTIDEDNSPLKLGLYPIFEGDTFVSQDAQADVKGPWYAVDNFRLRLVGRQVSIDWEMETPTYGTIILPFEVSEDELTEKGLEIYSVTTHVESTAEGATHHILQYTQKPKLEAHTPYIVKIAEASSNIQAKAVKAPGRFKAESTSNPKYTFEGFTTHEEMSYTDTYSNGSLTGMFVETGVDNKQYHLQDYEGNIGFVLHEEGVEHETFAPYHAYITLPEPVEDAPAIHGLYFEEPILPLDWYMEGENYGTIILPFEAEIPEELNAYTVKGVGEKKDMPGVVGAFYHLLQIESVEETDGVRLFEANVPYLVVAKSAEAADQPEEDPALDPSNDPTNEDNPFLAALRKSVVKRAETEYPTATFRGQAINTTESNTVGILTGVHVDKTIAEDEPIHVIAETDKTGAFLTNNGVGLDKIFAHHAYISADNLPADHGEFLLLTEPEDVNSGIEDIMATDAHVDVYTINGILIETDIPVSEALSKLAAGIYILRSGDVTVKVIK